MTETSRVAPGSATCRSGKKPFASEEEAVEFAARLRQSRSFDAVIQRPYPCPHCRFYHLTSSQLETSDGLSYDPATTIVLREMRAMRQPEFDDQVRAWALDPEKDDDSVLAHPALIQRTRRALGRILRTDAQDPQLLAAHERIKRHALRFGVAVGEISKRVEVTPAGQERAVFGQPTAPTRGGVKRLAGRVEMSEQGVQEIRLVTMEDLSDAAATRLAELNLVLQRDQGTFEDAVFLWATTAYSPWEDDMVFQSAELVQPTTWALVRLRRAAEAEMKRSSHWLDRLLLQTEVRLLGQARNILKPYVNLALAKKAKSTETMLALKVMRTYRFTEFRQIRQDFRDGMTTRQAEAAYRERLGLGERQTKRRNRRKRPRKKA